METDHLPQSVDTTFILDQTAEGEFLSLDDLGKVLTHLASLGMILVFLSLKMKSVLLFAYTLSDKVFLYLRVFLIFGLFTVFKKD